jgi:hypothetical protein
VYLIFGLNFSGVGLSVNGNEARLFVTEADALRIAIDLNRGSARQGWHFTTLPADVAARPNHLA